MPTIEHEIDGFHDMQTQTQALQMQAMAMLRQQGIEGSAVAAAVNERLQAYLAEERKMWKGGVEPMPFDEFSVKLDGARLTGRQIAKFRKAGLLRARNLIYPPKDRVQQMILAWGKGSGKDWLSARFIAWVAYVVCHLSGDPALYFKNLGPLSTLAVINVAPNEDLAKRVFFGYLKRNVNNPLFNRFKKEVLASEIKFYRDDGHGNQYEFLGLYSLMSRSSGLDGYNVLAFVLDEADAFIDTENRSNAKDIHHVLISSANTRMGSQWVGIVISYTRTEDGYMLRLMKDAEGAPGFLTDLAASWDVRPGMISRDDPQVAWEYKVDPRKARAEYECKPMATDDGLFAFPERIAECVDETLSPIVQYQTMPLVRTLDDGKERWFETIELLHDFAPVPGMVYFGGVDGGKSGDSYAISIWHVEETQDCVPWLCPRCGQFPELRASARYDQIQNEELLTKAQSKSDRAICGMCGMTPLQIHPLQGMMWWWMRQEPVTSRYKVGDVEISLPTITEDLLIELKPHVSTNEEPNRVVDYLGIQSVLCELGTKLKLRRVLLDPWNTETHSQALMAKGIDAQDVGYSNSKQVARARCVTTLAYCGLLRLLPGLDNRVDQWRKLKNIKGIKIDHPQPYGAKDLYDAEAAAIWAACEYKGVNMNLFYSSPPSMPAEQGAKDWHQVTHPYPPR